MTYGTAPLRTVLVGLGSTVGAADAARFGHRLATAAGASLRLVAPVLDPFADVVATRAGLDVDRLDERLLERARRDLLTALGDVLPAQVLTESLVLRLGRAEQVVAHEARRYDAEVVVLCGGSRRNGREVELARHLVRTAARPIVLPGARGAGVESVTAAVDLSFAAEPTIRFAHRLATLLNVDLDVVHVTAPVELPPEWTGTPDATQALVEGEDEAAAAMLVELLPGAVRRRSLHGPVLATLRGLADETPSALLVVGAQGRGWVHRRVLGSTTDALISECGAALAVVPTPRRHSP